MSLFAKVQFILILDIAGDCFVLLRRTRNDGAFHLIFFKALSLRGAPLYGVNSATKQPFAQTTNS